MDTIKDIVENKDCDNCPAKDECKDHHCETKKNPSDMSCDELNDFLDQLKHKSC